MSLTLEKLESKTITVSGFLLLILENMSQVKKTKVVWVVVLRSVVVVEVAEEPLYNLAQIQKLALETKQKFKDLILLQLSLVL
jgi:hypothetical protein